MILFILLLQCLFEEPVSFHMDNDSSGPVQVRIWVSGKLIHSHQMPIGNHFKIRSNSTRITIQYRKLTSNCDTNSTEDLYWDNDIYLGNNWWQFDVNLITQSVDALRWVDPKCNKLKKYLKQV